MHGMDNATWSSVGAGGLGPAWGWVVPLVLAVMAGVALAGGIYLYWRREREGAGGASESVGREGTSSPDATTEPDEARRDAVRDTPADDELSAVGDIPDTKPIPQGGGCEGATGRRIPTVEEATVAEADADWVTAAQLWRERGDLNAELKALRNTNNYQRMGVLELALDRRDEAAEHFRKALSADPANESVRAKLVATLLDLDRGAEAKEVVAPLLEKGTELSVSGKFIGKCAAAFEAAGDLGEAIRLYKAASQLPNAPLDTAPRIAYLQQLERLIRMPNEADEIDDSGNTPPVLYLQKALSDSRTDISLDELDLDFDSRPEVERKPVGEFSAYEVVVGHLALGGSSNEPSHSVRSRAAATSRFSLERLIGERRHSAVFEGVDKLLDCPVALRLQRLTLANAEDYETLKSRLMAISRLNHPNLNKMTYADRHVSVLRIVTEYYSGGSLVEMVDRLDKVGLPLMLRMMMQVAAGVGAAHRQGVLHGDLRPQNIMVGHDQLIKVVDFAIQPWPVRVFTPGIHDDDTPRIGLRDEEIHSDLAQFADVLDFLLERTTVSPLISQGLKGVDPMEELQELSQRARQGSFSSMLHVYRILGRLLEQSLPGGA